MTHAKKQMKITKLFKRGATQLPEDCDDIQEEIKLLKQRLKEKHDKLLELQRNDLRQRYTNGYLSKASHVEKKLASHMEAKKIFFLNSIESSERNIELMALLSGMEVQSYKADDHCTIVYHMQHDSEHQVKHGLKIDMKSGTKTMSASSLPPGFNLSAVLDDFSNVMLPECLVSVRKALVAYYDRLEQFHSLKNTLKLEAELFKIVDGSHMEIKFLVRNAREASDEQIAVTLMLDYRVYDIRPKQWSFVEIDLPDSLVDALKEQCAVFKRRPLHKAFNDAFIDGVGPYVMVQQMDASVQSLERRRKQAPSRPNNPYNDDTFHPEDCSSEDDIEE